VQQGDWSTAVTPTSERRDHENRAGTFLLFSLSLWRTGAGGGARAAAVWNPGSGGGEWCSYFPGRPVERCDTSALEEKSEKKKENPEKSVDKHTTSYGDGGGGIASGPRDGVRGGAPHRG